MKLRYLAMEENATIRHFWMTVTNRTTPNDLRRYDLLSDMDQTVEFLKEYDLREQKLRYTSMIAEIKKELK